MHEICRGRDTTGRDALGSDGQPDRRETDGGVERPSNAVGDARIRVAGGRQDATGRCGRGRSGASMSEPAGETTERPGQPIDGRDRDTQDAVTGWVALVDR